MLARLNCQKQKESYCLLEDSTPKIESPESFPVAVISH